MAKSNVKKDTVDYKLLYRELTENPPARLYMLRGEEDYLRDSYLDTLRKKCVPEGLDSFNYHRLNGPKLDLRALSEAVESVPFMGERTLVELRDFDINRTSDYDTEAFGQLLKDIPEWTTLALIFSAQYTPDGRLAPVKAVKKYGLDCRFTAQSESDLILWLRKNFKRLEKDCSVEVAAHILYVCGSSLHTLQQELNKLASLVESGTIRIEDVDAVATKQPETQVYELSDALGRGQYDTAARMLSELLADKDSNETKILWWISEQMRQLYCAKLTPRGERGRDYMLECMPSLASRSFLIPKLQTTANSYSLARLARAVEACAECEFAMRDGGGIEDADRLKELLLKLAMDKNDD